MYYTLCSMIQSYLKWRAGKKHTHTHTVEISCWTVELHSLFDYYIYRYWVNNIDLQFYTAENKAASEKEELKNYIE